MGTEEIEDELEVRLREGVFLADPCVGTEELCRRDGYLALCQWQDVDTGRQTGCTQHHLLLLVIDQYIVDDHPVEETQVHPSDGNLGT